MSLLDTLQIGGRGLGAAAAGIDVTSHNVANVNTPGFRRRRLVTATATQVQRNGLFLGTGVKVTGVRRETDRLLSARVVGAAGSAAAASMRESVLTLAESYFDESGENGVHGALAGLYDALAALSADPSDTGARAAAVGAAARFSTTTRRVATGLTEGMADIQAGVTERISTVNGHLAAVAQLNKQIGRSGASFGPADLLDRRDQLVRELGELVGARVEYAADGQATVMLGGHAVVSGKSARSLTGAVDSSGDLLVSVDLGSADIDLTGSLGGEVGGLLQSVSSMGAWRDELDSVVVSVADALNAQHALGFDANGAAGGALFSYVASSPSTTLAVDAALSSDPSLLALAGDPSALAGDDDNLQALLGLESAGLVGGLSGADALASLIAEIGGEVASATVDAEALGYQLDDLQTMWDAISQVDADEEALALVAFQAAYNAAARVVSAADEMLKTLMAMGA